MQTIFYSRWAFVFLCIFISACSTSSLKNTSQQELISSYTFPDNIGSIVDFSESFFSSANIKNGLWKPLQFKSQGLVGLYFTEQYDPQKNIVLFVHGINDSPGTFQIIANNLEKERYQVWFYYYPSGARLKTSGRELFDLMSAAKEKFNISHVDIIAHSMGGLVARNFINRCTESCSYLSTFTSISTPWGGHNAAKLGLKYAPTTVPVWHDLVPESDFLTQIFSKPIPNAIPHYLIFGIQQKDMLVLESNDGVVSLASMLNQQAQSQASKLIAFNENHTNILKSEELVTALKGILKISTQKENLNE